VPPVVSPPLSLSGIEPGARIRLRRKELGKTQQEMADSAEVSRQTIITMETGAYAPSVYLALKVARFLESSVESLWG
jgi:putative transcriptional regulator